MLPIHRNEIGFITFSILSHPSDCDIGIELNLVSNNNYSGDKFSDAFVYSIDKGETWLPYKREQKIFFNTKEDGVITENISFRTIKDLNTLSAYYISNGETNIYGSCTPMLYIEPSSPYTGSDVELVVDGDMEYLVHTSKYTISKDGTKTRKQFEPGLYYQFFSYDDDLRKALVDVSNLILFRDVNKEDDNVPTVYDLPDYSFYGMFRQCERITKEPTNMDDIQSVGKYCCYEMFAYCSYLEEATSLFGPITVSDYSCAYMYRACTSLSKAPLNLPANNLKPHCYRNMFQGCSSLDKAPNLGFSNVADADYCCFWMFVDCISMRGPVNLIPTSSFPYLGFVSMFSGCKNLNEIIVHFDTWPGGSITGWVSDVADIGTFMCPETLGIQGNILRGDNYCPVGWTVVNI